jgi:hypothetical protein
MNSQTKTQTTDVPQDLTEKATARLQIWRNLYDLTGEIDRLLAKGGLLGPLGAKTEVGRIFDAIKQIGCATELYFRADEDLDLKVCPNLQPLLQDAINQANATEDDEVVKAGEHDLAVLVQYRNGRHPSTR